MADFDKAMIEALADAWASIDGKVDAFRSGKGAKSLDDEPGGYYSGYISDAEELAKRLLVRGFIITPERMPAGRNFNFVPETLAGSMTTPPPTRKK